MRGLYLLFALVSVCAAAQNPEYSAEARLAGLEGTVQIMGNVAADGAPRNLRVTQGLGLGLDEKALEVARQQRFATGAQPSPAMPMSVDFLLPDKHSRWHLTGVTFEPPEGATRPFFLSVKYPLGSGITLSRDDTAIDEARILAAVGRQAWAVVTFDIDEHGVPRNLDAPEVSLEVWKEQAIALVRDWRFTPGIKDDKPVAVRCTLNLVWGDRNLSTSQLAKAHVEDMPLPLPPAPPYRFPSTPGVARVNLTPSEAAQRLVQSSAPEYPPGAWQAGLGGAVLFNVLIGIDGHVQQALAINRTSRYVPEAAQAVMQWIYRPVMVNGIAAEAVTVVPVAVPAK